MIGINDTISAISTPHGRGGVAVIRISGQDAIEIAGRMTSLSRGRVEELSANSARHCRIFSDGKEIDDGIITVFRAPNSYTGEDTVELSCHGGIMLTQMVLESAVAAGARPAEAGEFTRRAFINGKLGLSAAEAVADLIDSETREQVRLSRSGVSGRLDRAISEFCDELSSLLSEAYVRADYPDEDLGEYTDAQFREGLSRLLEGLKRLSGTYRTGSAVAEGIRTVIAGLPNTGKSSLLNRFLNEDRAIVTDIPGTTRDVIEETVAAGRVTLRLCDTAGLRESSDRVEMLGVERSKRAMSDAGLIIAVFDGSKPLEAEELSFIDELERYPADKLAVMNKSDLERVSDTALLRERFDNLIELSAKTGEGFERLIERIESMYLDGALDYDSDAILTNARQLGTITAAIEAIGCAISALDEGFSSDVAGLELERALAALGQLDGRSVSEEITNRIFSRFCVGK